ncbi:MAG: hypothetical protein WAJ93_01870 [Candidatus Nitrosopolaris sp.]
MYHTDIAKDKQRFWKRIMIVDDEEDVAITFKAGIEDSNNHTDANKRIEVYTSNNPVAALSEFKVIDINVRICFMSAVEINLEGLREIYPSLGLGCFIRKPVTIDYLVKRIMSELDWLMEKTCRKYLSLHAFL